MVKKLLRELEDTTNRATKKRTELFAEVQRELKLHEAVEVEEEIVYPAFREKAKLKDIVMEGLQEHHVVELLMGELDVEAVDDEMWGPKLKVMQENVEHHVEEEKKMFVPAEKLFSAEELEELGKKVEERKALALQYRRPPSVSILGGEFISPG